MTIKVGINGFGRIGRQVTKALFDFYKDDIELLAVNDLADSRTNAHLFKYDSNYGRYPGTVSHDDHSITIDGKKIKVLSERDPAKLPWKELGVDVVIESTGVFKDANRARAHIDAGAKKVIISAPAKNEDLTIVLGVNDDKYDTDKHHIVSNASCTTNCLAPAAKVIHDTYVITKGLMTTIHSYTNGQSILDLVHKDLRRARAAALNIIPTTTGAAKAISRVMPELDGKLDGYALRVPTPTVSLVDLVCNVENAPGSVEELNDAFKAAAAGPMKGILGFSDEPLVSTDYKGDPRSSIIDGLSTMVMGDMLKIVTWYDNEWGYSVRTADLAHMIGSKL